MKRLFLLRHAKAVPAESGIEDFDRTLMLSGMQDAGAMARYLHKSDYSLDLILCSASARTTQTAELVLHEIECEIEYRDNLYLAEPPKILAAVRAAPASVSALMIVGHNPGMEGTIRVLTGEAEPMPTAAIAIINLEIDSWKEISAGTGKLQAVVRPRDQMEEN